MRRIGHALIFLAFLASAGSASPARSAPTFLGVSTVGLEPPPGFVPHGTVFQKGDATIFAGALSAAGYRRAEADRVHFAAIMAGPEARIEPLPAGAEHGYTLRGRKTFAGVEMRVWILQILKTPTQGALVVADVPVADTDVTDAVILAAFRTIAFRDTPGLDAQIGALRFVVGVPAGFNPVAASAEVRQLELDDAKAGAHIVIHANPAVYPTDEATRQHFADQFFWGFERVAPTQITERRQFDANGVRFSELHAEKTDAASRAVVDVTFFVRMDAALVIMTTCTAPHPAPPATVDRFRALAVSVRPKAAATGNSP